MLIVDSREQLPLEFKAGVFDEIKVDGMPFGDYWCELDGKEVSLVFERKGIGDLFGTLTSGHDRFSKMLEKAKWAGAEVVLLIEGTMEDVFKGYKHSTVSGETILKTVFTNWVRHGLTPVFCPDRRSMARFIEESYAAIQRNYKKQSTP